MDTLNLKEWHQNGEILRTHLFFGALDLDGLLVFSTSP